MDSRQYKVKPSPAVLGKPGNEDYFRNVFTSDRNREPIIQKTNEWFNTYKSSENKSAKQNNLVSQQSREDQLTPPLYHQMPETFRRAHPLAPGRGIPPPERSYAPNPFPEREYKPSSSQQFENPFTTIDYNQMPELFQRAHPTAPGGGLPTPPRSFAPLPMITDRDYFNEHNIQSSKPVKSSNQKFQSWLSRPAYGPEIYNDSDLHQNQAVSQHSNEDVFTPSFYHQMPEIFRNAHPLAPGGGIVSPQRTYAPNISPDSQYKQKFDQFSEQFVGNAFTTIDYNQMPEIFRRAHPTAPGGGLPTPPRSYAPFVSIKDRNSSIKKSSKNTNLSIEVFQPRTSRPATVPNIYQEFPFPQQNQLISSNLSADQLTTPYYKHLPELFKKAHPIVPGGGIATPQRIGAPPVLKEKYLQNNERITSYERNVSVPQHSQEDELTPLFYHKMPEIFRKAHPLAPGGGIVSPERTYAPPPYD